MSVFGGEPDLAPRRGGGSVRIRATALAAAVVVVIIGGIALFLVGMEVGRRQGVQEGIARMMPSSIDAAAVLGPELPSRPVRPETESPVAPPAAVEDGSQADSSASQAAQITEQVPAAELEADRADADEEESAPSPTPKPRKDSPRAAELERSVGRPPAWENLSGTRPPPTGAGGSWAVQVLATPSEREALLLVQKLEGAGFPVFVTPTRKEGQTWYRVRVGTYGAETEARKVARELRQRFELPTWVME